MMSAARKDKCTAAPRRTLVAGPRFVPADGPLQHMAPQKLQPPTSVHEFAQVLSAVGSPKRLAHRVHGVYL
jgi:hypothetical protein